METGCKKKKLLCAIQAFFISFACTVQFHKPILWEDYEEKIDYLLAETAEFLGEYRFLAVLLFVLAYGFVLYADRTIDCREEKNGQAGCFPPFFPSAFLWGAAFVRQTAGITALAV